LKKFGIATLLWCRVYHKVRTKAFYEIKMWTRNYIHSAVNNYLNTHHQNESSDSPRVMILFNDKVLYHKNYYRNGRKLFCPFIGSQMWWYSQGIH